MLCLLHLLLSLFSVPRRQEARRTLHFLNSPARTESPVYSLHTRQWVHLLFEGILQVNAGKLQRKREAAIEGSNH